jgi:hypothetical protein
MKKVIVSIAVIVMSAGAVVATNVVTAKSKKECTCPMCPCPMCGGDCCAK